MRLCDRFEGRAPTATVCLVLGSELMPWVQHVRRAIPVIDRGYQEGLDSGDILWAGYLVMYRVVLDAFSGKRLDELLDGIPDQLGFTSRTQNPGAGAGILAHQIVLSTLAGRTKSVSNRRRRSGRGNVPPVLRKTPDRDGDLLLQDPQGTSTLFVRPAAGGARGDTRNRGNAELHRQPPEPGGPPPVPVFVSGGALERSRTRRAIQRIQKNLAQLKVWSDNCPDNFLAKRLMVEAELARITGQEASAADLYDRAIDAAHDARFLHDEAVANELAAKFVMERRPHARWAPCTSGTPVTPTGCGSDQEVEELEVEFPQLLTEWRRPVDGCQRQSDHRHRSPTSTRSGTANLDLQTLVKAGQTISGEVVLGGYWIDCSASSSRMRRPARRAPACARRRPHCGSQGGRVGRRRVPMSIPIDSVDGALLFRSV